MADDKTTINVAEFLAALRYEVRKRGSPKAFADFHGISSGYLSAVMNGSREPGPKLACAIGYRKTIRRVVEFDPIDRQQEE